MYREAYGVIVIPALNLRVQGLSPVNVIIGGHSNLTAKIIPAHPMPATDEKAQIRKTIRKRRKSLTEHEQQLFARKLANHVLTHIKAIKSDDTQTNLKIAIFLSMDGEIGTNDTIQALWQQNCEVYLPRIHPFNPKQLIFLRYEHHTKLIKSKLGMFEPELNCQQLCPVSELDIIFTPLVAFDAKGHRLGMGGGFYDRTLAPLDNQNSAANYKPRIIGLAHNCQQVEQVPTQSWDLPLSQIITPNGLAINQN